MIVPVSAESSLCFVFLFSASGGPHVGYLDRGGEVLSLLQPNLRFSIDELQKRGDCIKLAAIREFSTVNELIFYLREHHPQEEKEIKIDFMQFVKAQRKCQYLSKNPLRNNTIEDPHDMA